MIIEALSQSGWAIQYVEQPSEDLQIMAVKASYESLQYIKNASDKVKLEALKKSYLALRYIENPSLAMKSLAIKQNIQAMRLLSSLSREDGLALLRVSSRVEAYLPTSLGIGPDDILAIWKEKLEALDPDREYLRELASDGRKRKLGDQVFDLAVLAYQYGSLEAKQVCMDTWLG